MATSALVLAGIGHFVNIRSLFQPDPNPKLDAMLAMLPWEQLRARLRADYPLGYAVLRIGEKDLHVIEEFDGLGANWDATKIIELTPESVTLELPQLTNGQGIIIMGNRVTVSRSPGMRQPTFLSFYGIDFHVECLTNGPEGAIAVVGLAESGPRTDQR